MGGGGEGASTGGIFSAPLPSIRSLVQPHPCPDDGEYDVF